MGLTGLEKRLLACSSKPTLRTILRQLGKRAHREAFLIDGHVVQAGSTTAVLRQALAISIAIRTRYAMLLGTSKMASPWRFELHWVGYVSGGQLECYDGAFYACRHDLWEGDYMYNRMDMGNDREGWRVRRQCRTKPALHHAAFRLPVSEMHRR